MKVVRVYQNGGPDKLVFEDQECLSPGPGEALVRVGAAGVNFIDTYHRNGLYPLELPFTLGIEGSGSVAAIGEGVQRFSVGDRVAFAEGSGTYAEYCLCSADRMILVPQDLDFRQASAVMLQGMTAHYLAHDSFELGSGHTALIHAGAGGVGLLLTQMAKRVGTRVITTVSTDEKAALSRDAGADEVILYTQVDFGAEVDVLTDGGGVDVVYDSVAKDTFEASLDCLRVRGTLVLYGNSSGPVPPVDPLLLNQKGSLFMTRPKLGDYVISRAELECRATAVLRWVADGSLKVRSEHDFALADAADAHRALEGRGTMGKVLLIP